MVAIYALVGNIIDSASRVGRSNASVQITMNAIETMTAVNPMVQESGTIDLGPYAVTWRSAAITPIIERTGSLYQIGLYNMEVQVKDQPGSVLANFTLARSAIGGSVTWARHSVIKAPGWASQPGPSKLTRGSGDCG